MGKGYDRHEGNGEHDASVPHTGADIQLVALMASAEKLLSEGFEPER
jgi:hypothetical protein